jgi:hypothetical protein
LGTLQSFISRTSGSVKVRSTERDDTVVLKVLDPIDGTKGFLKGDDALYVVRLSTFICFFFLERTQDLCLVTLWNRKMIMYRGLNDKQLGAKSI